MDWIITKDLIYTKTNEIGYGDKVSTGIGRKPYKALVMEKSDEKGFKAWIKKLPYEFRLLDGDDEVYYEGKCGDLADACGDKAFEPLDWAMNDSGCTTMEYRMAGERVWEIL